MPSAHYYWCNTPRIHVPAFPGCSYVFDGKPPEMKSGELTKRAEKRAEAEKDLAKAQEQGYSLLRTCMCWVLFGK